MRRDWAAKLECLPTWADIRVPLPVKLQFSPAEAERLAVLVEAALCRTQALTLAARAFFCSATSLIVMRRALPEPDRNTQV